jgi:hypothetical protein
MATDIKRKSELKNSRKIGFVFLFVFVSLTNFAQFNLGEMYQGWFTRKDNAPPVMHRMTIDLVFNRWMEEPPGISLEPYSIGINIYRMYDIPFNKHVGISIGLGISSQNYHHNGQYVTIQNADGTEFTAIEPFPGTHDYKRNKIALNYFEIPFELRFRSSTKPRFSVYPGFKAGYLFNGHTKTIDNTGKYKNYNVPGLAKFNYGVSLRMGWGKKLSIYAYYQLSTVFEKDKGVEINPLAIGFTFYIF